MSKSQLSRYNDGLISRVAVRLAGKNPVWQARIRLVQLALLRHAPLWESFCLTTRWGIQATLEEAFRRDTFHIAYDWGSGLEGVLQRHFSAMPASVTTEGLEDIPHGAAEPQHPTSKQFG